MSQKQDYYRFVGIVEVLSKDKRALDTFVKESDYLLLMS